MSGKDFQRFSTDTVTVLSRCLCVWKHVCAVWLARPCSPRLRSDWVAMEATAARLLHLQHSGESVAALRKGMNGHHPNAFSSGICTGGLLVDFLV